MAGLYLLAERLIIHSAHQFDTSKEGFERILTLIQGCPDLDRLVARVSRSHGDEGITLKNGQRLQFRTRTAGGGRGFTADCLILDEAMFLTPSHIRALLPTLSARPNPQVWYLGSAGTKTSVAFGRLRRRGYRRDDPRLMYAEWAADICNAFCPPDCTEHDDPAAVDTWLKTNPGAGIRISLDHIRGEYHSMDPESFAMERLGVGDWPVEEDGWAIIDKASWMARHDARSCLEGPFALAVAVPPTREFTAIAAAGANPDGFVHGELTGADTYDYRPGTKWAVKRIIDIWTAQRPAFVVIDKATPAGTFIAELEDAGVIVVSPTTREYAQACGEFRSSVVPGPGDEPMFVHLDQEPVTRAVGAADKRTLTGLWAWDSVGIDVSPIEAITLACWGYKQHLYAKSAATPWAVWG